MQLPTLYKQTSTGKVQEWSIRAGRFADPSRGEVIGRIDIEYGQTDGKKQQTVEFIESGKNVGRSNETTPVQQAELEAKSRWEKQVKKGYVQSVEEALRGDVDSEYIVGGVAPMLAHGFDKQGHKITYPAFVQPKLDGHRCIAIYQRGKCTLWSRTRKLITSMPHIEAAIEKLFEGTDIETIALDGELYNHDYRDHFEELTSLIRQEKPAPGHEKVQYWIYDAVLATDTFARRKAVLANLKRGIVDNALLQKPLLVVESFEVQDEDELMASFQVFLDNGFEGAMVRNAAGMYKIGKRSYDLQKIKEFQDAEFEVIGVEEGRGKMAGHAMFVCRTPEGGTFRVKMKGAMDDLARMYQESDKYIGRMLTVKFQGITNKEGVPRFPVAERFREDV